MPWFFSQIASGSPLHLIVWAPQCPFNQLLEKIKLAKLCFCCLCPKNLNRGRGIRAFHMGRKRQLTWINIKGRKCKTVLLVCRKSFLNSLTMCSGINLKYLKNLMRIYAFNGILIIMADILTPQALESVMTMTSGNVYADV